MKRFDGIIIILGVLLMLLSMALFYAGNTALPYEWTRNLTDIAAKILIFTEAILILWVIFLSYPDSPSMADSERLSELNRG